MTPPPPLGPSLWPTPPNTEVIPLAWFHSSLAWDKFLSRFINRPVHACEKVDGESVLAENLGFTDYILRSHCGQLLDLRVEYYSQLVRILYGNVKTLKMGLTFPLNTK